MCSCIDLMRLWDVSSEKIADLMEKSYLVAYYRNIGKKIVVSKTNKEAIINRGVINYKIIHGISEEVIFDDHTRRKLNHPKSYYSSLTNDQVKPINSKPDADYDPVYLYGDGNIIRPMLLHLEKDSIAEMARGLYFLVKDINSYARENSLPILDQASFEKIKTQQLQEQPTVTKTESDLFNKERGGKLEDPEAFIRSMQVSYVSDTEIKIKAGNQRSKIFNQKEMGFIKINSEIWKAFIDILRRSDHTYYVGKARGAQTMRKASYDVGQKRLSGINEKLLSFLNETYQLRLLKTFKVYELIPEKKEAPGGYRFKFQVCNHTDSDENIDYYDKLTEKDLISKIEILSSDLEKLSICGDTDSEKEVDEINNKLNLAVKLALKKEWININRAKAYLNPEPASIFPRFDDVHEKKDYDRND